MSQGRYVWIAGKKVYLNSELQKEWDKLINKERYRARQEKSADRRITVAAMGIASCVHGARKELLFRMKRNILQKGSANINRHCGMVRRLK